MSRSRHRRRDAVLGAPQVVDRPIHVHYRVPADEVVRLINDPEFMRRAHLLLHERAGHCFSGDPTRCYNFHHKPPIDVVTFVQRLFGIGARPADGKRYTYDWKPAGADHRRSGREDRHIRCLSGVRWMVTRQLSMRLDGLCDVCRYPLTDGCQNPVCGGTDSAYERFVETAAARDRQAAQEAERKRLLDLSFGGSTATLPP